MTKEKAKETIKEQKQVTIDAEIREYYRNHFLEVLSSMKDLLNVNVCNLWWSATFIHDEKLFPNERVWEEMGKVLPIRKDIKSIKAKIEECEKVVSKMRGTKDPSLIKTMEEEEKYFEESIEELNSLIEDVEAKVNAFTEIVTSVQNTFDSREAEASNMAEELEKELLPSGWVS